MTPADFDRRVIALQIVSSAVPAARSVLVEGQSINGAAREHGFAASTVLRLKKKIEAVEICECCGQVRR